MHREILADSVPRSVQELHSLFVQRRSSENVDQLTSRSLGKDERVDSDVTLEHASEGALVLGSGLAEMISPGSVDSPVEILRTRVVQIRRGDVDDARGVGSRHVVG